MKKLLQNDVFIGLALALVAFGVYLATMAVTVQYEDCGEVATSLYTLGIVHPTGYPLFTLLGWVFSHLPLGGRVIWKLNLLVAILCAVSVYFFYRLFLFMLSEKSLRVFGKKSIDPRAKIDPVADRLAAVTATLALAFSQTFWSEAVSVEVYAFHLFFLPWVTLLFLRALSEGSEVKGWRADGTWMLFAFMLGLCFTNHMMTVLLAPAFLYLFFTVHGFGRPAWVRIGRAVPPFLLGLSPYLYIPIRSSQQPLMNWGNPSTLERFWWHISGAQYHYKMFSSVNVAVQKSSQFFSRFPSEFGYAPLLLAAVGLWALWRGNRRLLVFTLLLFVFCVVYGVNYDFEDPNYYLHAYFATAIAVLVGARALLGQWKQLRLRWIGAGVCAACVLFPLSLNYAVEDRSHDFAVEDYARDMLKSVEPGGILLVNDDKLVLVPVIYLQIVEGVRPDVVILSLSVMMYGWGLDLLQRLHPGILDRSGPELESFLRQTEAYEAHVYGANKDVPFDVPFYHAEFTRLMESAMWRNYSERAVYVKQGVNSRPDIQKVPVGLAFRLFLDSLPPPAVPVEFSIRPNSADTTITRIVHTEYARAYTNQGIYRAVVVHDTALGVDFLRRAILMKPDYEPAHQWLARLGAGY